MRHFSEIAAIAVLVFGISCSENNSTISEGMGGKPNSAGEGMAAGQVVGDLGGSNVPADSGGVKAGVAGEISGQMAPSGGNTLSGGAETTGGVLVAGEPSFAGQPVVSGQPMNSGGQTAGEAGGGEASGGTIETAGMPSQIQCEPALTLKPTTPAARPYDLVRFAADGGTGAYRFSFLENGSNALLNDVTGAYLAGEIVGTIDRVRVIDDGCLGEAVAEIQVVPAMSVNPSSPEISVNTQFRFEIDHGSGSFSFDLLRSESGANVTPDGVFTSGPNTGVDTVRVTDVQTNEVVDVNLSIVQAVELRPRPRQLIIPVGSQTNLIVDGGSGRYDVSFVGEGLEFDGTSLRALNPGRFNLIVRDHFVPDLTTTMTVDVVSSLTATMQPFSDLQTAVRLYNPGDLNGDGLDDLVIASNEADVEAGDGGAVFVYHSTGDGAPSLVQSISGLTRQEDLGRAIDFADFNGDNLVDMAIGARLADPGFNDAGQVQVHLGQPDGTFEQAPNQILSGIRSGDYLGWSVAACDFNGDGRMDIAASAIAYEDAATRPQSNTQGGVFIFLGYEDGFLAQPDQIIVGQRLTDNGNWSTYGNLQLGSDIAAGDMNGDGRCDLVASATRYTQIGQGMAGAVFVYAGTGPNALSAGGVSELPVRAYLGVRHDNGGGLGRRLAMGDLNGDGLEDLIVAEHAGDLPPIDGPDQSLRRRDVGVVYVIPGHNFDGQPADTPILMTSEPLRYTGDSNYDNFGIGVALGDYNGDGLEDLIVGAYTDDAPGRNNTGKLWLFAGRVNEFPSLTASEKRVGTEADMRLGESLVVTGDHDNDGDPDIAAHAFRSNLAHPMAGHTFLVRRKNEADLQDGEVLQEGDSILTPVAYPRRPGFSRFGQSVALVPTDSRQQGVYALVVSPYSTDTAARSGHFWKFVADENHRFDVEAESIGGFVGHTYYDLARWARPIGDFDGDGYADMGLLLQADDRVSSGQLNSNQYALGNANCDPQRNNTGGLFIFRGLSGGGHDRSPGFVYWGTDAELQPEIFESAGDFNGDGLADIVIGGIRADRDGANDVGLSKVIVGRPYSGDGRIQVICDTYDVVFGSQASDNLGRSVIGMGDINGDGCDDYAVGSPNEDAPGRSNQGGVRIIFGWGAAECIPQGRMLRLATGEVNSSAGWSLAASDFDNDGRQELVIGARTRRSNNVTFGGVWVVPGTFLSNLTPRSRQLAESESPVDVTSVGGNWVLSGSVPGGDFARSIATSGSYLAVGAINDDVDGVARIGSVRVYRITAQGIVQEPVARMIGETWRPGGRLGESLHGLAVGDRHTFIAGAPWGNGGSDIGAQNMGPVDNGSAYIFSLVEPLE